MLTLHYSECCLIGDDILEIIPPVLAMQRGPHYEQVLRSASPQAVYKTYDELCLLVAQYLRRKEKLPVQLVAWCNCRGQQLRQRAIPLDDDGDMVENPFHGFFSQRLPYLR